MVLKQLPLELSSGSAYESRFYLNIVHLFMQQIFVDYLLFARPFPRLW